MGVFTFLVFGDGDRNSTLSKLEGVLNPERCFVYSCFKNGSVWLEGKFVET
jgi:hypothetical protein